MDDEHCWKCCDGAAGGLNGRKSLLPTLHSHKPVDVVVLALGCNDMKTRFGLLPQEIAEGCELLLRDIAKCTAGPGYTAPQVVLMSPPAVQIKDNAISKEILADFGPDRAARALQTAECLKHLAESQKIPFIDLTTLKGAEVAADGLHFDEESSAAIATATHSVVSQLFVERAQGDPPAKRQKH